MSSYPAEMAYILKTTFLVLFISLVYLFDYEEELNESFYAVAIYHDENSNKKFDTFLSLPKEQYGFSNNAPVFFGTPNFEDAAVFVEQNKTTEIEIELR